MDIIYTAEGDVGIPVLCKYDDIIVQNEKVENKMTDKMTNRKVNIDIREMLQGASRFFYDLTLPRVDWSRCVCVCVCFSHRLCALQR